MASLTSLDNLSCLLAKPIESSDYIWCISAFPTVLCTAWYTWLLRNQLLKEWDSDRRGSRSTQMIITFVFTEAEAMGWGDSFVHAQAHSVFCCCEDPA